MSMKWIAAVVLVLGGCASKAAPVATRAEAAPVAVDAAPAVAPLVLPPSFSVELPGASPGQPSAELVVSISADDPQERYGSTDVHSEGNPPWLRSAKDPAHVRLRVDATGVQRLLVEGVPVFVPARAGDHWFLTTLPGRGGWSLRSDRQVAMAGKTPARCRATDFSCGRGQATWRVVKSDTSKCDADEVRCVAAPRVRLRGTFAGEVHASSAWDFADGEVITDAVRGHAFELDEMFTQPWISLGEATAYLAMGPGESWEVWLAADGTLAAAIAPQ
jgi:hypothetical protein